MATGEIAEPHPGASTRITPPTGISATTLTGSASLVNLPGTNTIQAIGSFSAPGGFTLDNVGSISVGGLVASTVSLVATGNVGLGSLSAASLDVEAGGAIGNAVGTPSIGTLTGSGASLGLTATIDTLGSFTTTGSLSLTGVGSLDVAGPISASAVGLSAGNLVLDGVITANSVIAESGQSLGLEGGVITAASVGLTAMGGSLVVSGGTIDGGSLALTAAAGPLSTRQESAGQILQTGGVISAGTLSGQSEGPVSLGQTGVAAIGTLSAFGSGSAASPAPFTLNNAQSLAIANSLSASSINISAPGSITLGNGATSATDIVAGNSTIAARPPRTAHPASRRPGRLRSPVPR